MDISFDISETDKISEYFNENGYVVINNVFTAAECKEIFEHVGEMLQKFEPKFNIYDISTYDLISQCVSKYGIISRGSNIDPFWLNLRQHPNIYKCGKIFIDDFIVSHDKFIFYRPTKDVLVDGKVCQKIEWGSEYIYPGLHLDMDPKLYYHNDTKAVEIIRENTDYRNPSTFISEGHVCLKSEGLYLQGMINVLNNNENDGGFTCVPGFPQKFDEWFLKREHEAPFTEVGKYVFNKFSHADMDHVWNMKRIPSKAGSLIIWDRRMAHTGKPNVSNRQRLGIPIAFTPKCGIVSHLRSNRRKEIKKMIDAHNFNEKLTDVGKIVYDL